MSNRRDFIRLIIVVSLVWLAVVVAVSRWQGRSQTLGPRLIHYPGTEAVQEQTVPALSSRKYWFTLQEEYPSLSVYQFYQRELGARGWELVGTGQPTWVHEPGDKESHDTFTAFWVSRDRVYQLELQQVSTVTITRTAEGKTEERREPGMKVYVTQQHSVGPWLLEPKKGEPGGPSIDMKGQGQ